MVIELILLGVFIGMASGFLGIGGGLILVPSLMSLGFDIKTAIGISVMQMIFSSILGSYINYKAGILRINASILALCIGALLGASLSGFIVKALPSIALLSLFASILLISIYKFFTAPLESKSELNSSKTILLSVGIVIGAIVISTGTGGAVFLTPFLVGFMHWDIKKAIGTTLFFIVFSSISGFISLSFNHLVDYHTGFMVSIGSLIGVYLGVKLSHYVSKKTQKRILLLFYNVILILTLKKILHDLSVL